MSHTVASAKYYGPTNTKGARIKVQLGNAKPVFVPFNHGARNPNIDAIATVAKCSNFDVKFGGMDGFYIVER